MLLFALIYDFEKRALLSFWHARESIHQYMADLDILVFQKLFKNIPTFTKVAMEF